MVVVQGQAELLEVVRALRPPRGLAGRLDRGQQQRDENGDDCDDDEQLDQGKTLTNFSIHVGLLLI